MHHLMISTAWTKEQFALSSSRIARKISRSNMGLGDDIKEIKPGDAALIKTAAISTSLSQRLRDQIEKSNSGKKSQMRKSKSGKKAKMSKSKSGKKSQMRKSKSAKKSKMDDCKMDDSICDGICESLSKLKDMYEESSAETKAGVKAGMMAAGMVCISTLFTCINDGKSASQTIALMTRNGVLAGLSSGVLSYITEFAVNNWDSIKGCVMGITGEMTEHTAKQYCTMLVGAGFTSVLDIVWWIMNGWKSNDSWGEFALNFLSYVGDSIAVNLASAGIAVVTANALPAWATMVVMLIVSHYISQIKQEAADNNTSVIGSILYGVSVIPLAIYNSVMKTKNDAPEAMCCIISKELLEDPVLVQNQWMERSVAMKMVENQQRGPIGTTVTRDCVIESAEMRNLVNRYRSLYGEER